MREFVFFLEERSAKEMLNGLLPKILEQAPFRCIAFEGKQDMQKQLEKKLKNWRNSNACFIVMHDQDQADCLLVKQSLTEICRSAGKPNALVRIVCRELESWYLGDLRAVESGLGLKNLARHQRGKKFRDPDRLQNPKQELKKLTEGHYGQILGSREIGHHLSLEDNLSTSFKIFLAGLNRLLNREIC